ncbi:MAG: hypothetical protein M1281_13605 [Chloroflexi bacterium]|nr:hypothetical protein [Chloroflexota bacterium]
MYCPVHKFAASRLAAGLILVILSLPLIIWAWLPPSQASQGLELSAGQYGLADGRRVILEWTPNVRMGDKGEVNLTLAPISQGGQSQQGKSSSEAALTPTHVLAVARLELTGGLVSPVAEASEPLLIGKQLSFYWNFTPASPGTYPGTVWLHLRFIPADQTVGESVAVSAQKIGIHTVTFLGLTSVQAKMAGAMALLLGGLLAVPIRIRLKKS